DPRIVDDLLAQGMTIMRVNCAHDGPDEWRRMVAHLRAAQRARGSACKIVFDLAGPKLRTGPIADGPEVVRYRPVRDQLGRTVEPVAITVTAAGQEAGKAEGVLPVDGGIDACAHVGDSLHLHDARGRARALPIVSVQGDGLQCT